jgi:hypothetical protein
VFVQGDKVQALTQSFGNGFHFLPFSIEEAIMKRAADSKRPVPTTETRAPNLSTENQPKGSARRPSDTLDREPKRDPHSGGSIPSDYNPETMTRVGEEDATEAGKSGAGRR